MAHFVRDTDPLITIDQYERLPDSGERIELLHGRLIREPRPAYGHGILQARILDGRDALPGFQITVADLFSR